MKDRPVSKMTAKDLRTRGTVPSRKRMTRRRKKKKRHLPNADLVIIYESVERVCGC